MLTEGVHSLVDTGNELLLLYGVRSSKRVTDEWHPFGYPSILHLYLESGALKRAAHSAGQAVARGPVQIIPAATTPQGGQPTTP
jgi:hypothetical protein